VKFLPGVAAFLTVAALALGGCALGVQTHSAPEHDSRGLKADDLRAGGIAFLTPSSITGHEEDKQALAVAFATALRAQRSDVRVVPLSDTIGAVNRAGIAKEYRAMYADYRDSALLDSTVIRQVAKAAGVRYLAQLKLASVGQGARGRFGLFGLSILNTQYAQVRVFLQIWDATDGSVVWEGLNEVTRAMETAWEEPMTFQSVADQAAQELVRRLP
jgi:hypothetical protein